MSEVKYGVYNMEALTLCQAEHSTWTGIRAGNERDMAGGHAPEFSKSDTLSRFVTQNWPTSRLLTRVIRQSDSCPVPRSELDDVM